MANFSRDDTPPKAGPKWWIERVGAGKEGFFTVISRSIYGVWTHWQLHGSQPCFENRADCEGCKRNFPRRWKGYLHAYDHHSKRQCFLEITPIVAESISGQAGVGMPLRGYRLKMKRGNGPKARIKVEVVAALVGGAALPDEVFPEETLRKLWSLNGEDDAVGAAL